MTSLQFSSKLNRMIRQDMPEKLGEPTRPFLEAAVRESRVEEARQWLDYWLNELTTIHTIFGIWDWYMVRYYLDRKGENTWPELVQKSIAPWISATVGKDANAVVHIDGRNARLIVPGGDFYLVESNQRFNLSLDMPEAQESRWKTWRQDIEAAIDRRDLENFTRLLDTHLAEMRVIHDVMCDWAWALLTVIAREWGEAILGEVLRVTEEPWVTARYEKLREMTVEESLRLTVEGMRGHLSGPDRAGAITLTEEAERYVLSFDACGTGGRMRRGDPLAGSGSRLEAPYHFLNIEKAYDWTWNRKGVCAYCAHCAVVNQILPIEGLGRPMRMTEYPESPDDPCRWIIYKDPNAFPDRAFISVGKEAKRGSP